MRSRPLIRCPDCGSDVSRWAYACPACGKPLRSTPGATALHAALWFVAACVAFLLFIAAYDYYAGE